MKRLGVWLLGGVIGIGIVGYVLMADYFTIAFLQEKSSSFACFVQSYYWLSVAIYIGFHMLGLFCGLPIVVPMGMIGGYLFGLWLGFFYSLIAVTVGSIAYFLLVRRVLSYKITQSHEVRLLQFKQLMNQYGVYYLLFLHFIIIVPYVFINTMAALTDLSLFTFSWTTFVGALPALLLYSYAGQQLNSITSVGDIIKLPFVMLFVLLVLLALLPIGIKKWRAHF